ncbi:MAG: hypothetical protein M1822_009113 [Bathelium mastoideum]|nr:MAG: hypothetical protein M1822_009113 [Bathelium mastoideum]
MSDENPNPRTPSEWRDLASKNKLDPSWLSVSDIKYNSASHLTEVEFIHLKVLWEFKTHRKFQLSDFVKPTIEEKARREDFTEFVDGIRANSVSDPHHHLHQNGQQKGLFTIFHYHTHLICRRPSPNQSSATPKVEKLRPRPKRPVEVSDITASFGEITLNEPKTPERQVRVTPAPSTPETPATPGSFPRTDYEAIVNMTLVLLLNLIRLQSSCLKDACWLPDPKPFTLRDQQSEALVKARVDGFLGRANGVNTFSILEVKPYVRRSGRRQIEWQEAAQMAAWIAESPGSNAPGVFKPPRGPSDTLR